MRAQHRVPVSLRALHQRINRELVHDDTLMRKNRSPDHNLGEWFLVNTRLNAVLNFHGFDGRDVDPEDLGRELGVLHEWEVLAKKGR